MRAKKYDELALRMSPVNTSQDWQNGVRFALRWLDEHPEAAPATVVLTIEERDVDEAVRYAQAKGIRPMLTDIFGYTVVPAPEPELPEHDSLWWINAANTRDAEDCDACAETGDLCPVHHGIALGIDFVTKKIALLADDPELFDRIPDPRPAPRGQNDD